MDNTTKWHNANLEKPGNGKTVLLRVEKYKNPNNVQFIVGYHSGYEYCDKEVLITHYDSVTHWVELP